MRRFCPAHRPGSIAALNPRLDTGDRTIYLAEVLDAGNERPAKLLTFKHLLELAPPARLQEMKQMLERDMELDRAAILEGRRQRANRD